MRHVVIMAGGTGTRLWPISRKAMPKQFQALIGKQTLLQQTFDRAKTLVDIKNIWVQTSQEYKQLVEQQLLEIDHAHIITEPSLRNTAPATGLAALTILKEDPEAMLFGILPADHYIGKEKVFTQSAKAAFEFLEDNTNYVVTIGIQPTSANTGLGYIKKGSKIGEWHKKEVLKVDSFIEKPDQQKAQELFESGEYLWNAGYYLFSAKEIINHYQRLIPETLELLEKYLNYPDKVEFYNTANKEAFDTAISEKLEQLAVIPTDMEWSDVGNWATLHDILSEKNKNSQVVTGNHIGENNSSNLILGGSKLIATVGLKDIVAIDTDDVLLICHKDHVHEIKKIVEELGKTGKDEYL